MSLVKFKQNRPQSSFNTVWDDFFGREFFDNTHSLANRISTPAVNIKDEDDSFVIELAAPGLQKDNFKVEVDHDTLSISSETKEEKENSEGSFTRREFNYSSFSRSFKLPETANSEKVEANYVDGVLKIDIPKKEEAKAKGPIAIDIK